MNTLSKNFSNNDLVNICATNSSKQTIKLSHLSAKKILKELDDIFVPLFEYLEDTPISQYQKEENIRHVDILVDAQFAYTVFLGVDSSEFFLQIAEIIFDESQQKRTEKSTYISGEFIKIFQRNLANRIKKTEYYLEQTGLQESTEELYEIDINDCQGQQKISFEECKILDFLEALQEDLPDEPLPSVTVPSYETEEISNELQQIIPATDQEVQLDTQNIKMNSITDGTKLLNPYNCEDHNFTQPLEIPSLNQLSMFYENYHQKTYIGINIGSDHNLYLSMRVARKSIIFFNSFSDQFKNLKKDSSYGLHIEKSSNDLEYWIKDEDYQYDFKNENNSLRIIQTYVDPYTEELESTSFLIADHAVLRLRAKIKQYLEESNACPDCSSCTHSKACGIESQMWFSYVETGLCYECKQEGHHAKECPERKCYLCHQTGHIKIRCPNNLIKTNKDDDFNRNEPIHKNSSISSKLISSPEDPISTLKTKELLQGNATGFSKVKIDEKSDILDNRDSKLAVNILAETATSSSTLPIENNRKEEVVLKKPYGFYALLKKENFTTMEFGQHNNNDDKEILSIKSTSGPALFRPSIRAFKQEDVLQGSSICFLSRPYHNCGIELRVVKVCLNAEPFYAVEFKAIENPEQNFKITLELAKELCSLIEHIYIPFWSLSFKPRQGPDRKVYRISKKFGGNREFIFDFKHQENSYCLRITEHNTNNKKVKTARSINIPANFLKELQKQLQETLKLAGLGRTGKVVSLHFSDSNLASQYLQTSKNNGSTSLLSQNNYEWSNFFYISN